ncbi:unnamed protein product [Spirodela intermedia]|uniref:Uncharacterized protein n=1 Tax=Spirodela intermedia TaxID=51605 RepID=A0A7I8JW05_SPIIN|nr:unnamed protein product [Spirodela intermedia]CAA6673833.1 unnamed protein product [Spirodela intermedia]
MEVGCMLGASSSGPRNKRRLFIASACTTTPCPTPNWSLVMWKGSGARVSPSVLVTQALACGSLDCISNPLVGPAS